MEEEKGGRRRCGVERKVELFYFSHQEFWRRQAPLAPPVRWCVSSVRFASVRPQMQICILNQYKEPLKGLARLKIEHSNLCRLTSWCVSVSQSAFLQSGLFRRSASVVEAHGGQVLKRMRKKINKIATKKNKKTKTLRLSSAVWLDSVILTPCFQGPNDPL